MSKPQEIRQRIKVDAFGQKSPDKTGKADWARLRQLEAHKSRYLGLLQRKRGEVHTYGLLLHRDPRFPLLSCRYCDSCGHVSRRDATAAYKPDTSLISCTTHRDGQGPFRPFELLAEGSALQNGGYGQ